MQCSRRGPIALSSHGHRVAPSWGGNRIGRFSLAGLPLPRGERPHATIEVVHRRLGRAGAERELAPGIGWDASLPLERPARFS